MARYDQQIVDHRNGDSIASAARTGAAIGEKVAQGHVDNYSEEETAKAKKEGAVVSSDENATHERNLEILRGATPAAASEDAGLSWGQSGGVQTSRERSAESIPPSAAVSTGISPSMVPGPTPEPSTFSRPSEADRDHNQSWNAASIFERTKIG